MWICIGCGAETVNNERCGTCGRTREDASINVVGADAGADGGGVVGADASGAGAAQAVAPLLSLSSIPEVLIDACGTFKYIQIAVTTTGGEGGNSLLIRGHARCKFHDDIFQIYRKTLLALPGIDTVECIGGGRVTVDEGVSVKVFGYSVGYGRCDHSKTVEALRRAMPELREQDITWDDDGY